MPVLLLLLLAYPLKAETVTLTLEEAIRRALDQSLNLKKSAVDLAQTEYSANRLWSEIFPGFSLNAGLTFLPSTQLFTKPGFNYQGDDISYAFNFGISLSLNPSFRSSMKRIELAYRSQLLSYENAGRQLEILVIKNFLGLINRQENIVYMEENLEKAEQKLINDRIARENGLMSELDWLRSRLSVETARYDLSNSRGIYKNALGEFLALLGMDAGTELIFKGTIAIAPVHFDPEQLIVEYLPKRPDIISQRQTIERLELTKNVTTHSSRSPTLNLATQWRGGSPQSGGIKDPFTDSITGSVTVTIPIDSWIPGTKQNQAIRAADAELEKARLDLQNTEISAKTQIRSLISNLNNTWESVEIARLRVELAQRTVEAAEEGFRNGAVESQDLVDRRKDLADARQRFLQEELSCQSMLLDLAAALNVDWKTLTKQQASSGLNP